MLFYMEKIFLKLVDNFLCILCIFIMNQHDLRSFTMYFQSTLRNIGLFTSLSYASLAAYSRFHTGTASTFNLVLIMISISFLSIAFILNYFLYQDMNEFIVEHKHGKEFAKWVPISQAIFGIHTILFMIGVFSFLRSSSFV